MTPAEILAKAKALPVKGSGKAKNHGRWTALWPAYEEARSRKYSCREVVDWLVSIGAITKGDVEKATKGFHMIATRKNRKSKPRSA